MPLKIKPSLFPAPSGRLLISRSYDLGYLLPCNFPSLSVYDPTALEELRMYMGGLRS
jgi:hypothetical protein